MTATQVKRTSPKTGKARLVWTVNFGYKHPDGSEKRYRRDAFIQTKRGAEQQERRVRGEMAAGTYWKKKEEKKQVPTLRDFSQEFMENYVKVHNKHSVVITKRGNLNRYILPELGSTKLDEIKTRSIDNFTRNMLNMGLNPKTAKNALGTLSKLLHYAEDLEFISKVPKIRFPKVPEVDFDFLTFEETEKLLKAAEYNPEWWGMIFFAIKTGLRYGELCELRWGDLTLDVIKPTMRVKRSFTKGVVSDRKNRKAFTAPLTAETARYLQQRRQLKHLKSNSLVFCKPDGGRHIHRRADVAIKRCCRYAGIREIHWHTLRHTFASHLAMRGRSLLEIKELCGHKDINSTLKYAHLMPEHLHDAVAVLDQPWTSSRQYSGNRQEKNS